MVGVEKKVMESWSGLGWTGSENHPVQHPATSRDIFHYASVLGFMTLNCMPIDLFSTEISSAPLKLDPSEKEFWGSGFLPILP